MAPSSLDICILRYLHWTASLVRRDLPKEAPRLPEQHLEAVPPKSSLLGSYFKVLFTTFPLYQGRTPRHSLFSLYWNIPGKYESSSTVNFGGRKSIDFLASLPLVSSQFTQNTQGLDPWSPRDHPWRHFCEKCFISTSSKSSAYKQNRMLQNFTAPYWGLVQWQEEI